MTKQEFISNCATRITKNELDFKELVQNLFCFLRVVFCDILTEILEKADAQLHKDRDASRYEYKYKKEKTVITILGEVTFERRYYIDHETGEGVVLLEKQLGIEAKVGSNLARLAVMWAIRSDTFREARDKLADFFGTQLVSHETIRQLTYDSIRKNKKCESEKEDLKEEEKQAPDVLVIEADEIYPGCQDEGQKRFELKFAMAHTGWQPVSGYGKDTDFKLKNKIYLGAVANGDEFWERFTRKLYSRFDLSDTTVIINGDGASWIRNGIFYFDSAIYSYNTYHVKKKLKKAVCYKDKWVEDIEEYVPRGKVDDLQETLIDAKKHAEKIGDKELEEKTTEGLRFIAKNRKYIRDYRERLEEMGKDTKYLRNLGASEAIARQFAKRLKDGRSWKKCNANLMAKGMANVFEGKWKFRGRLPKYEDDLMDNLNKGAGRLTDKSRESEGFIRGKMPGTEGTSRSLSKMLNNFRRYDRVL